MTRPRFEPWLLAVAILLPTVVTLAYFWLAAAASPGVQQAVFAVGKTIQFTLPVIWILGLLGRRPRWKRGPARDILLGGLFGLLATIALGLLYAGLSETSFLTLAVEEIAAKVQDLGVATPGRFVALGVFYALAHSLLEEYYWRWFVYGRLREWTSEPIAVGLSAVGFMLHHVLLLATFFPHAPLVVGLLSACVLVGGLFWAWLYGRSGSLLGPWLGHFLVDAGIFAVGYHMVFG